MREGEKKRSGRLVGAAETSKVEGSMSGQVDTKSLQEDLQSLGFTPSLAKLVEKEVGIRRACS